MRVLSILLIAVFFLAFSCNPSGTNQTNRSLSQAGEHEPPDDNPFLEASELQFKYPAFDTFEEHHYAPAFEFGMAQQAAEIESIANATDDPTFENTLVAMERSGQVLDRVRRVFFALTSANTNDALDAVNTEMAPKLAAHRDLIYLNEKLFRRVEALYNERDRLNVDEEAHHLIEKYYKDFIRAGAQLSGADKDRLKEINGEIAELQTKFSQNVLKEVNDLAVVVDSRDELEGMSEASIERAAEEATSRDLDGKYVITLRNTSIQPVVSSLENRDLRKRIFEASLSRGSRGGEFDNREALTEVARLRAERAQLLGYENHAAFILEAQTAKTQEAVNERLATLVPPAVRNAQKEAADLQQVIGSEGGDFDLAPWDWAFYAEKVRKARYDFDESELKPYLELDNVLQKGVFVAANKLYGLSFEERTDLPVYHPDVRVFEVFDVDGTSLSLFIGDFYARQSKRGGAWMNAYVPQSDLLENQPVVANHQNITKPPEGEPTLMTFSEVITMFHEFGHALHGMFSDVTYPTFTGTSVPRDFVEYPSQVNEMWASWPEILKNYAVHYETGEPMPAELLEKVLAAQKFNQGYATTEYLAASLLDQSWHQIPPEDVPDAEDLLAFEAAALESAGIALDAIPPRYRSTYFSHIIGGYSAGYYSYIWSEVLDADTVVWFKENGGLLRENGDHFRETLLSRGGSADAMTLFKNFRGAEPSIEPLLERRGLN
ncbi:MAG: M3 family metallopeptidase [Rhodothermaceae bacterium]|nr:M3 family metallopeptidase [Rhodothermaceae bacterium]